MSRSPNRASAASIRAVLRRTFGLTRLRDGQDAVISRVMAGLSTLALMPTGAGKSLCYQLPAMLLEGRTLVISPLIALMKDQCDALHDKGIAAVQLHSGLGAAALAASQAAVDDGSARIVFTTPEQATRPEFIAGFRQRPIAMIVVDEAHCLSQWGFDFRPAFLEIGAAIRAFGRPPVLALTATATASVIDDILGLLSIPRAGIVNTDLYRPNLHYRAEYFSRAEDKLARLVELVTRSQGSGLVYTATVKAAEEVQERLLSAGEPAGLYHGKLGAARRRAAQDAFMDGRIRVMVATNAFGLGVDKPDTRFVIHHQLPPGLDAYYQESGRAGRDGLPADCTLLFVDGDRNVQQFFLSGRYPRLNEFLAIAKVLMQPPPDAPAWTLDRLTEHLAGGRKTAVALRMMHQHGLVEIDANGQLASTEALARDGSLDAVAAAGEAKALEDRAMLERMVAYAQGGRCRWRQLLEHLEGTAVVEDCGTCDNCQRLAAHERLAVAPESADAIVVPDGARFAVGERVRTRRHGLADVVSADATSVTVQFDNGQTRCFQPQFLVAATRKRRRPAQASAA